MNRLIIIGASGHGKVVADIAHLCGYEDICFVDDNPSIVSCQGFPVVGTTEVVDALDGDLFAAIGNPHVRQRMMEYHSERTFPRLIHPDAVIADSATIGCGTVVMAGAVINPDAVIGRGVIVNTCASIDHDCVVSDFVHIAVGAHLCGTVHVGEGAWIGSGATIINDLDICPWCTLGAGTVVVKNLSIPGTYVGVPSKLLHECKD